MSRCITSEHEDYTLCGQHSAGTDTRDYRKSNCFYCRATWDRLVARETARSVERARKEASK